VKLSVYVKRRWVAGGVGAAVYAAVAAVFSGDASYTVHTVRYLTLSALLYSLLSGVAFAGSYLSDGDLRDDVTDLVGGIGITVGFGVFYATVLESGVGSVTATVAALGFVTAVTVFGFFAVLKL